VNDNGGPTPTMLPAVNGSCPTFAPGSGGTVTFTVGSQSIQAQVWAGQPSGGGPLIIYWHGTGSSPSGEIPIAFDTSAVMAAGGLIVGYVSTSRTGTPTGSTGDNVWYQSDTAFADQTVACAIKQYKIDTRHIHTAGYSAGGLQTVYMWYARSGYLASVISYSGGDGYINKAPMQDASNPSAAIAAHGAMGSDDLGLDFAQASVTWEGEIKTAGGFSIDCNDGGSHLDFFTKRAPGLEPVAWKFFNDHPYKVKPEPYTSLPSGFPSYCKID
jgi:poly(3-hydroxybutyrate) depolymerase